MLIFGDDSGDGDGNGNGNALRYWLFILILLGAAEKAIGAPSHVNYDGRTVVAQASLRIAAPIDDVRAILSNYNRLAELNPDIRSVRILAQLKPGKARMQVFANPCLIGFCRELSWTQTAELLSSGDIVTEIEQDSGDFRSGSVRYRLSADGEATMMTVEAELEPAFRLPPVIGNWLLAWRLRKGAEQTARGVERVWLDGNRQSRETEHGDRN